MKRRKNKSVEKPEDKDWNKSERDEDDERRSKVELRWVGPRTVEVIGGEDPDPDFIPYVLPLPRRFQ